ncbi:MAG: helix-turn-helix domain-containing protein [Deltaproteobacteria bacterium]|nr:helix-turn-helix domain-containing protein [Deltaproteobacteria bacterium]
MAKPRDYVPMVVNPNAAPIRKYSLRGRRILSLYEQGYSKADIARSMGMAPSTVSAIINNPTSAAILQQSIAEAEQQFRNLAPQAVSAMREALDSGQEIETRRKAAKDFFDVSARRASIKEAEVSGSAEELIETAMKIATESGATVEIAQRRHKIPNRAAEEPEQ